MSVVSNCSFDKWKDYNQKMSAEQQPVIQKLRQQQEKESYESREKYRRSMGQDKDKGQDQPERHIDEVDKKTEVKIQVDQNKLYEKRNSIFAYRNENQHKTNIFANSKSVNLMTLTKQPHPNSSINIFTMAVVSKPLLQKDPEDDLESHSSEAPDDNANIQVLPEPSQKVMKYTYEERTIKVAEFHVAKFKHGSSNTKSGLLISLEKEKENNMGLLQLIARTDATKIVVYQGWIPKNSRVQSFMGRGENLKIAVVHSAKGQQSVKYERQTIKLQFQTLEDSKKFEELITGNSLNGSNEDKKETRNEPTQHNVCSSEKKQENLQKIEANKVEKQAVEQ